MTFAFYTNIVSPHQLPLARESIGRIGAENYRYIYAESFHAERKALGWSDAAEGVPCLAADSAEAREWLENCDWLMLGLRDWALAERRLRRGKGCVYVGERWFKPIPCGPVCLPGRLRMLSPRYRRMAREFVRLLRQYEDFRAWPFGPWARRDWLALGAPASKMSSFGYFTEPSTRLPHPPPAPDALKVLWAGRMLDWKRADDIVRAVALANREVRRGGGREIRLTLAGGGEELPRLERMQKSGRFGRFEILEPRPMAAVRDLMHAHDVYVLASDAREGWGAALNEALSEGMTVFGTDEAGASAALLPADRRYPAGDVGALAKLLVRAARGELSAPPEWRWTPSLGADLVAGALANHGRVPFGVPLLLTASVSTHGMKGAAFTDGERERMYLAALEFYLREVLSEDASQQLVFAENSGWDLAAFRSRLESRLDTEKLRRAASRIEWIAADPARCDNSRGKGYNEILMMNEAVARSQVIRAAGRFMKATGRYPIYNVVHFLRRAADWFRRGGELDMDMKDHRIYDVLFRGNTAKWNGHAACTVLFATTVDFYNRHLADSYPECNDYSGDYIECVWYRRLSGLYRRHDGTMRLRHDVEMECGGMQGSVAGTVMFSRDNGSFKARMMRAVGNFNRRFVPWLWL